MNKNILKTTIILCSLSILPGISLARDNNIQPSEARDIVADNNVQNANLHRFAYEGDIVGVKRAIGDGIAVDSRTAEGVTALQQASYAGHSDVVSYLTDNNADVNAQNKYKKTVLQHAVLGGNIGIVDSLTKKGARLETEDEGGSRALHYAAHAGNHAIVNYLIANKAEVTAKDKRGRTALDIARSRGEELKGFGPTIDSLQAASNREEIQDDSVVVDKPASRKFYKAWDGWVFLTSALFEE